jgi:replicative DNA helicase
MRSVPVQIGKTTAETTKKAMKLYGMSEADRAQALEKQSMKTGMIRFDSVTGGLKPSDLIIIGARPSIGKSALGLHLSRIFALKGNKVLFISLEMSSEQISRRLLAAESGVPYSRIEEGYMSGGQAARLVEANERLADIPLVVDDKAGQSVSDIRVKAMREQARGGVDLIVVDYLQKAAVDETSFADVTAVSNGLKALAKDLKIPVVALCQLSRSIENRDSRRPQLSDLKQSGAIEADADLVAFLWYPRLGSMDELEFDLQKHRNGGLGQVLLAFDKNRQQFEEIGGG